MLPGGEQFEIVHDNAAGAVKSAHTRGQVGGHGTQRIEQIFQRPRAGERGEQAPRREIRDFHRARLVHLHKPNRRQQE